LSIEETVLSVAKQFLGDSYKLREDVVAAKDVEGLEVYSILTQVRFPSASSLRL
jgi:hypothetical protein